MRSRDLDVIKITENSKGERHSFNGQPSTVLRNGISMWHRNGRLHRFPGPAVTLGKGGEKYWFIFGIPVWCSIRWPFTIIWKD